MRSALFTCCVDKFIGETPFRQFHKAAACITVRVAGKCFRGGRYCQFIGYNAVLARVWANFDLYRESAFLAPFP